MSRSKAKKSKPVRQAAPPPPRPTRRISDSKLMRMLDAHMQESLSDIAVIWQRLFGQLGYKAMHYEERVKVQTSFSVTDNALDNIAAINNWRRSCERRGIDSRGVMAIVTDGASIQTIMNRLCLTRTCVCAHMRACLTLWSFWRKRCDTIEVNKQVAAAMASSRSRNNMREKQKSGVFVGCLNPLRL